MTDLAILVPVRRRPQRVTPLLDSIGTSAPGARVLFLVDPDDIAERHAVLSERGREDVRVKWTICRGGYARKINVGVRLTTEPLIFLGADDLDFHPGWLEAAATRLSPPVGVVGTNDLGNRRVRRGEHATHSLVARSYADEGSIDDAHVLLHEGYDHNFVDDEFVATARHRDSWDFAPDSHVEHLHPNWGKAEGDETYDLGQRHFNADRRLFRERTRLWT